METRWGGERKKIKSTHLDEDVTLSGPILAARPHGKREK